MSTLAKIQPSEFYASFMRLFHGDLSNRPKHLDAMYEDLGLWTEFMLHDLLPESLRTSAKARDTPRDALSNDTRKSCASTYAPSTTPARSQST